MTILSVCIVMRVLLHCTILYLSFCVWLGHLLFISLSSKSTQTSWSCWGPSDSHHLSKAFDNIVRCKSGFVVHLCQSVSDVINLGWPTASVSFCTGLLHLFWPLGCGYPIPRIPGCIRWRVASKHRNSIIWCARRQVSQRNHELGGEITHVDWVTTG